MTTQTLFKKICTSLGKNNKPTYVVMAIASVKGICRPLFTMMDKKEDPATKKYTALREGLTEIIAIPAYFACGEITSKCSVPIISKYMKDKFSKIDKALKEKGKPLLTEATKSEELSEMLKKGKNNLMFIGVCTAALVIIPGLCSIAIRPIMDKMNMKAPHHKDKSVKSEKKHPVLDVTSGLKVTPTLTTAVTSPIISSTKYHQLQNFNGYTNIGLKVGGV